MIKSMKHSNQDNQKFNHNNQKFDWYIIIRMHSVFLVDLTKTFFSEIRIFFYLINVMLFGILFQSCNLKFDFVQ